MIEQYECNRCGFWTADYEVTWQHKDSPEFLCDDCYWYIPDEIDPTETVRVLNSGMRTFVGGN